VDVGFVVLSAVITKIYIFWDITPCRPVKSTYVSDYHVASIFRVEGKPRKELTLVAVRFELIYCLAYSSVLKMEPTYSSETSVNFHLTTRHYIPEDIFIHAEARRVCL
jgi:hypothetical protein